MPLKTKARLIQAEECLRRRCPRLGGEISFRYCRDGAQDGGICFKILDCWWETFDVAGYLRDTSGPEVYARLADPNAPRKVSQLLQTLNDTRKRLQS